MDDLLVIWTGLESVWKCGCAVELLQLWRNKERDCLAFWASKHVSGVIPERKEINDWFARFGSYVSHAWTWGRNRKLLHKHDEHVQSSHVVCNACPVLIKGAKSQWNGFEWISATSATAAGFTLHGPIFNCDPHPGNILVDKETGAQMQLPAKSGFAEWSNLPNVKKKSPFNEFNEFNEYQWIQFPELLKLLAVWH